LLNLSLIGQELVAHTCNPSYLGSKDQEDHGSKLSWAHSSLDPVLKIPITKRAGRVAQGGLEYQKKKLNVIISYVSKNPEG
jgi:hypothetical protein